MAAWKSAFESLWIITTSFESVFALKEPYGTGLQSSKFGIKTAQLYIVLSRRMWLWKGQNSLELVQTWQFEDKNYKVNFIYSVKVTSLVFVRKLSDSIYSKSWL